MFNVNKHVLNAKSGLVFLMILSTPVLAAQPVSTSTSIDFINHTSADRDNPVWVNDAVDVVGSVVAGATMPIGGKLRIKQYQVDNIHVSCEAYAAATTGKSESIIEELDPINSDPNSGVNSVTAYLVDTSMAGSFSYALQYVPAGGSGYAQSQSGCINLVVEEHELVCTPAGFSIAITESTGSSSATPGSLYTGGFDVTVKNCTSDTIVNVSAQGGTSGWTDYTGYNAPLGTTVEIRNQNKRNEVLKWTLGDLLPNESKTLSVFLSGNIKSNATAGTILFLSGAWSALSGDNVKTPYTGRVTIEVTEP